MTPRRLVIACWIVFAIYAWPGYLPAGAPDQLVDSRVGAFTDWAPPMMTGIWRALGLVVSGPVGLVVLQSGLVVWGAFMLARRSMSDRAAAFVAGGVLLWPPVMATLAVVTPVALFAGLATITVAALGSSRRWIAINGLGFALLGCAMGASAALAVAPIVIIAWPFHAARPRWQRFALATISWFVLASSAFGLSALLVDKRTYRREIELAALDVVGTIARAPDLPDTELARQLDGVALAAGDDLQLSARRLNGRPERYFGRLLVWPDSKEAIDGLLSARERLAWKYPCAYAAHRWNQFVRILGLTRSPDWHLVYTTFVPNRSQRATLQHAARHAPVQKVLIWIVRELTSVVGAPYLYVFAALGVIGLAVGQRQRLSGLLVASALAGELVLAVTSATTRYQDSTWLIVATTLAAALGLVGATQMSKPTPTESPLPNGEVLASRR